MKYYIVFNLMIEPNCFVKKLCYDLSAARTLMNLYPGARMKKYDSRAEALNFYNERSDDDAVSSQKEQDAETKYYVIYDLEVAPKRLLKLFYHDLEGAQAILSKRPEAKMKTFSTHKEALKFYNESSDNEEDESQEEQNQDYSPTHSLERVVEIDERKESEWL